MTTTSILPSAVFAYVHHNRRVAALVTLRCTTDFALRTEPLQKLGHELAMHAAALRELKADAPWLRDCDRTVKDVIDEVANQLREPVHVSRILRVFL